MKIIVVELEDLDNPPEGLKALLASRKLQQTITKEGTTAMDSNKILAKLLKIAANQQKMIEKLAQQADPTTLEVGEQPAAPAINVAPPATSLEYTKPTTAGAAILAKVTDPNKSNIPMPMGLAIEDGTLYWFTRNKMEQPKMLALHESLKNAIVAAKKEFGTLFPDLNTVRAIKYRSFSAGELTVGQ